MNQWIAPVQTWWDHRLPREQLALKVAGGLVVAALTWGLLVLPAWRTLTTAPQKLSAKQAQLLSMQSQSHLSKSLGTASPSPAPTAAELVPFCQRIDPGLQCTIAADQVRLVLNGVSPAALPGLLRQARQRWQLLPTQAQWTRDPKGRIHGAITMVMGGGA